jgi:hypothetical protein
MYNGTMEEDSQIFETALRSLLLLLESDINKQDGKGCAPVNPTLFGEVYHFCKNTCKNIERLSAKENEKRHEFVKKVLDCKEYFVKLILILAFRRDSMSSDQIVTTGQQKLQHGYVTCCLFLLMSVERSIGMLIDEERENKTKSVQSSKVINAEVPLHGRCLMELTPLWYELASQLFDLVNTFDGSTLFEDYKWGMHDSINSNNVSSYSFAQQRTLFMIVLLSSITIDSETITAYITNDRYRTLRMIDILKNIISMGGLKNTAYSCNETSTPTVPPRILDRACRCLRRLISCEPSILDSNPKLVEDLLSLALDSKQYEIFYILQAVPDCAKHAMNSVSKHLFTLLEIPIRSRLDNFNYYDDGYREPKNVDWGVGGFLVGFSKILIQSVEHYKDFMQLHSSSEDVKRLFHSLGQRWSLFRTGITAAGHILISDYETVITNFATFSPTIVFPFVQGFISEYQEENLTPDPRSIFSGSHGYCRILYRACKCCGSYDSKSIDCFAC